MSRGGDSNVSSDDLEHTLRRLERGGGSVAAASSKLLVLRISLSESRSNGSVISAVVSYSGPTLMDGTPLRRLPDGSLLRSVDGEFTPEAPGFDALKEAGVRDELIRRGWKANGAEVRKDWPISVGADRVSLREGIEDALAIIGPDENLELTYRAPGSDAGFAQVGCAVIAVSSAVAAVIGVAVVYVETGSINPIAAAIGFIAGWLAGMFVASQSVGLAVRVRRSRPNAENVAIVIGLCASGMLAVILTVLFGRISAPG
jgi:hypothetical protein